MSVFLIVCYVVAVIIAHSVRGASTYRGPRWR